MGMPGYFIQYSVYVLDGFVCHASGNAKYLNTAILINNGCSVWYMYIPQVFFVILCTISLWKIAN